jgi:NADH-quinone oxidoreductase subunit M
MNFPILSSLIILPTIGALFLMFSKENNTTTVKYVALFTSFVNFLISIYLWVLFDPSISIFQFVEDREWLKGFINYKIGIDGISILFIILTTFITPICIISVNNSIKKKLRDFLISILKEEYILPLNFFYIHYLVPF